MKNLTITTDEGDNYIIPENSILYCCYNSNKNKSYLVLNDGKDINAPGKKFFNACCGFYEVEL